MPPRVLENPAGEKIIFFLLCKKLKIKYLLTLIDRSTIILEMILEFIATLLSY